jgi:hypothetical protein
MFHYTTYTFNKTLHIKKRDLIPVLLRSGAVESDGQHEALILGAIKKISHILVSKLKQHINTSRLALHTYKYHDMLVKKQTSNGSQKPEVDL